MEGRRRGITTDRALVGVRDDEVLGSASVFPACQFRTIIIGISTLIALPSYRNAIIDLFGAIKPKRISNSRRATGNVINVTSNTIVMRSTDRKSDT
ncbi:unnamed protein product [Toxocara canis]|uniref:Uncharacterized protein n=1 Tax=Toxocara canis TaxID=6265 RepID=A0A183UIS9_TOXCA|nr:unnamed protein product [Toxocara canis]